MFQAMSVFANAILTLIRVDSFFKRVLNYYKFFIYFTFLGTARGIVFVLDSFSLNKDIRDVAEYTSISITIFSILSYMISSNCRYLYTILSDPVVLSNRPQVLILCNKQDHALAKGPQIIQSILEKEMSVS